MFVKICGITSEEDALLAVALGADAVGFVLAPSPRQMRQNDVGAILRRLPPEILTVGVFRDETPERVALTVSTLGLGAAQLHGHESAEASAWVAERVPLVIKAFAAGDDAVRDIDAYGARLILMDAPSPGSGEVFDWSLAEGVVDPRRLILSGGLTPENVAAGIEQVRPWGVDVASGVESAPGVKDPAKMRTFVRNAREAQVPVYESPLGEGALFDWQEQGG